MRRDRALYNVAFADWCSLRDEVRHRARGRCEFCGIHRMSDTHHRWGYGEETAECLMAVCRGCHMAIHGRAPMYGRTVFDGSLAWKGDTGFGRGRHWLAYLESFKQKKCEEVVDAPAD